MSENQSVYSHHIFVLPFAAKGLESFPKSFKWKKLSQDTNELPYLNLEDAEKILKIYKPYVENTTAILIWSQTMLILA